MDRFAQLMGGVMVVLASTWRWLPPRRWAKR